MKYPLRNLSAVTTGIQAIKQTLYLERRTRSQTSQDTVELYDQG